MRAKLATCVLLLAAAAPLHAAPLPTKGMTMTAVEKAMGTPREKAGPVGRPPITRWVYDGFVVVFEHNKVVQSVNVSGDTPAARPAPAPKPDAPAPDAIPVEPAATEAAIPVTRPNQTVNNKEAIRRAAEQEADEKARAATEAARKAADAASATTPATAAPADDAGKKDQSFSFDPATGRIIINQ